MHFASANFSVESYCLGALFP